MLTIDDFTFILKTTSICRYSFVTMYCVFFFYFSENILDILAKTKRRSNTSLILAQQWRDQMVACRGHHLRRWTNNKPTLDQRLVCWDGSILMLNVCLSIWHIPRKQKKKKIWYNIYTTSAQRLRRWSNIVQIIYGIRR